MLSSIRGLRLLRRVVSREIRFGPQGLELLSVRPTADRRGHLEDTAVGRPAMLVVGQRAFKANEERS